MKCSLRHEKLLWASGTELVAGIDEAGRGPLAGPVVAAVAILPRKFRHGCLRDSKQLSATQREEIFNELTTRPDVAWACAVVESQQIDRVNILRATHEAMREACLKLEPRPGHALIDGLPVPLFPFPHTALVDGDCLSYSIAAASVLAKVTRDRIMVAMDLLYPEYEFHRHKGYGTRVHLERLNNHGPCPIHRRSFLPVRQCTFPFA